MFLTRRMEDLNLNNFMFLMNIQYLQNFLADNFLKRFKMLKLWFIQNIVYNYKFIHMWWYNVWLYL